MDEKRVGLIGATSLVGECLQPLLVQNGWRVTAFSRRFLTSNEERIKWRQFDSSHPLATNLSVDVKEKIDFWLCVAPIWVLPEHFGLLEAYGVRRVVALSSTSRFTKDHSSDLAEQDVARRLLESEDKLKNWAEAGNVEWVILRPTLIYGLGRDKNIAEIANFIYRFGFFPLLGRGEGLRQPVHAEDVAQACLAALEECDKTNNTYNLSGGDTLTYREMVRRIFIVMERRPRFLTVPLWMFRSALMFMRFLPRYRHWTAAMAERMNSDLVFASSEAVRDLKFCPRPFQPKESDLPVFP